jgi:uncharacterized membrane protein
VKKNAGIVLAMILYAFLAIGIVFVIYIGGTYPVGADAMSHVYKGNVLYHNISRGNWYPLYDNLWFRCCVTGHHFRCIFQRFVNS